MSLINDMLRDLEARRDDQDSMQVFESVQSSPQWFRPRIYMLVLMTLGVFFLLTQAWSLLSAKQSDNRPLLSSPVASGALISKSIYTELASNAPENINIISADQPIQAMEIGLLLRQGIEALNADRLSLPEHNNAITFFRQVLDLDQNNLEATEGLIKVRERYKALIDMALADGKLERAKVLFGRAKAVGMAAEDQQVVWSSIEAHGDKVLNLNTPASQEKKESTSLAIAMSWEFKDQQTSQSAQVLFDKNQRERARQLLRNFVQQSPHIGISFRQLFKDYLLTQDFSYAESLVTNNGYLPIAERAYLLSRIDLAQGQAESAIAKLEQYTPENKLFRAYYGLLAALYQRTDRHLDAANHYRQLLQRDREQPDYWLGLGISLDALGQRQQALQAFQFANRFSQINPRVKSYIRQRIQALSS